MLKSKLILFLLISVLNLNAQETVPRTTFTRFSLKSKNDTIDFVVTGTDLIVKKPVFLFVQGSLPVQNPGSDNKRSYE